MSFFAVDEILLDEGLERVGIGGDGAHPEDRLDKRAQGRAGRRDQAAAQQEEGGLVVLQRAHEERGGDDGPSVTVANIGRVKKAVTVAVDLGDALEQSGVGGTERGFELVGPFGKEAVVINWNSIGVGSS